jgi:hypothetical protein
VTALLRIYQRGGKEPLPVHVTGRILDRDGKVVWTASQDFAPREFAARREADCRVEPPLTALAAGQYLLELAADAGNFIARSDLRFQVR